MNGSVFFMGVTEYGLACFKKLVHMGVNIVGCIYTNDQIVMKIQPEGMRNVTYIDFKAIAEQYSIDCIHFDKTNPDEFVQCIKEIKPDLIIVAGWHYIIKPEVYEMPRFGTVGLHPSMLPRYRGGSPLVWQIINGESKSGVSLFYIADGIDTGDVIGQESFTIDDTDTIKEAYIKSQEAAVKLLEYYVPQILNGAAPRIKQNENDATYVKQRCPADGEIDWSETPENIRNFIRAQSKPYPGAFTYISNKKVIIWDAEIVEDI